MFFEHREPRSCWRRTSCTRRTGSISARTSTPAKIPTQDFPDKSRRRNCGKELLSWRRARNGCGHSCKPYDFFHSPNTLETNIGTFVVAGKTGAPNDVVTLNGTEIPAESKDDNGGFALAVPLDHGQNTLTVTIGTSEGLLAASTKLVHWNPSLQTGGPSAQVCFLQGCDLHRSC
jgi:hypothetical protein